MRLPEDWTPPPIDTLPQTVQAVVTQWPKGAYEFVADGFAAYWTAESGRRASKRNWRAAWIKWLTGESSRVMAMARGGIRFLTAARAPDPATMSLIAAQQEAEDARSSLIRRHLREDLGDSTYDGWLKPTSIWVLDGPTHWTVHVHAPSEFMAAWVRQHFSQTILAMARRVIGTDQVTLELDAVAA
jgi:hypothetical protein